jgi:hypothetical protein
VNKKFIFLPYLNAGLLTGQSKVTGREGAQLAPVWAYYNEVIPNAVRKDNAHRRFVHYHSEKLKQFTNEGNFNFFVPIDYGGLGFTHSPCVDLGLTSFQRRFATFLKREALAQVSQGTIPKGGSVGIVKKMTLHCPTTIWKGKPKLTFQEQVGPLNEGFVDFEEKEVKYPILALRSEHMYKEQKIRLPKKATMRSFRTGVWPAMGNKELFRPLGRIVQKTNSCLLVPEQTPLSD